MDESLFMRIMIKDKVKLQPANVGLNIKEEITKKLLKRFEGICTRHGYIRKGSVEVLKISLGKVEMTTLNGDITYTVQYTADVCNPSLGCSIKAKIINMNKFGILAEAGIRLDDGAYIPVLDIIIAKQAVGHQSEINLDKLHINDEVTIEVLGKKFELNDTKISIVGRVLASTRAINDIDPSAVDDGLSSTAHSDLDDDDLLSEDISDEDVKLDVGPEEEEEASDVGFASDNDLEADFFDEEDAVGDDAGGSEEEEEA
jgi:DNA-directed RNA polymerase subunit E'/Rpb7